MKKIWIFILLSCVALNTNIFSMKNEKNIIKKDAYTELSISDWTKITAASLGSIGFMLIAARIYRIMSFGVPSIDKKTILDVPAAIMTAPYLFGAFLIMTRDEIKNSRITKNIILSLSSTTSVLLAGGLGWYVWKKLSKLRSEKSADIKKIN